MQLGIFARTFARPNLEAVLDAVAAHGLRAVHFNLCCAGLPTMPERIDEALCDRIRREMAARDLTMASISGTYNMCHPEAAHRREYLRRLGVLVRACRPM